MKFETKHVELRILSAGDNMVLTNGETYGKTVYLGKADSPDKWYEITDAEYEKILSQQEDDEGVGE